MGAVASGQWLVGGRMNDKCGMMSDELNKPLAVSQDNLLQIGNCKFQIAN
jgi:hypothetical protein